MADNSKHLDTLGEFWDRMTSGQRLSFFVFALSVLLAGGGIGYWFGRGGVEGRAIKAEGDKTLLEIELRKEITKLESDLQREKLKPPMKYELHLGQHEDRLPELDEAEFDSRTIAQYAKDQHEKSMKADTRQTRINQQPLAPVGKRFDWQGFVEDVDRAGKRIGVLIHSHPVPNWSLISDPDLIEQSTWCYFDAEKYEHRLREFSVGEQIHLTGVMDEKGNLYKCQLR